MKTASCCGWQAQWSRFLLPFRHYHCGCIGILTVADYIMFAHKPSLIFYYCSFIIIKHCQASLFWFWWAMICWHHLQWPYQGCPDCSSTSIRTRTPSDLRRHFASEEKSQQPKAQLLEFPSNCELVIWQLRHPNWLPKCWGTEEDNLEVMGAVHIDKCRIARSPRLQCSGSGCGSKSDYALDAKPSCWWPLCFKPHIHVL